MTTNQDDYDMNKPEKDLEAKQGSKGGKIKFTRHDLECAARGKPVKPEQVEQQEPDWYYNSYNS